MVGPATGEIEHHDASHGVLGALLVELFDRGMEPDPERPPRLNPDKTRPEYVEFPVMFASASRPG